VPPSRHAANPQPQVPFNQKLVLQQWLLGLFGAERFDRLAEHLREETLEGLDENNVHKFHHALCLHLPTERRPELPDQLLLEHDQAIVAISRRLNERRITRGEAPIVWKYFQYLALLFTEIYLDRYFRDPQALLAALNTRIAAFNAGVAEGDRITPLDETRDAWSELNKVAFWMATGSGKTLLMHAHILQYRRFLETHGRARELNRIILLTPNEGLSQQHLREFEKAGIEAEIFNKDGRGLFTGQAVEILEVTKLKEEMGEKTVAVDAFEGNNLVLVDEGHRGASAGGEGAWMKHRNALCERGFSFEYSATFEQAVKGSRDLTDLYARSTLFDYSYRWFYGDGFGKDYEILNLETDGNAEWTARYLTGCLLAFYEQQRLHREHREVYRPFDLEPPLWVFVGGSVTATLAAREAPDIVAILRFFDAYVANRAESTARVQLVLQQGLITATGKDLFASRFDYLHASDLTPAQIFDETLATVFNAPGGGALYVENLKGAAGEVAVRVGENEPFGVINVGDDAKLVKLCGENGLNVSEREFAGSLFHELGRPHSTVNVLIGSKKFTEGWSSWRVSTMGLMNVGRGEGAQIIQLFGRGVRLKGYGMSLKRSARVTLPEGLERPPHIATLETLHIFGIRADYMAQFREYLKEEGLPVNEDPVEIVLPVVRNLGRRPLKIIRLKQVINGVSTEGGDAFRRMGPIATLQPPDPTHEQATEYLQKNQVVLNWYPKIQAMASAGLAGALDDVTPNQAHLDRRHIAFLDLDRLYFELERFKAERGWHNLNVSRIAIGELLADRTWYRLLIPESELVCDALAKVRVWHEIAVALLKKYTERYYTFRKREWEVPHLEYRDLTQEDPNFPSVVHENGVEYGYRVRVEGSQGDLLERLRDLKAAIARGEMKDLDFEGVKTLWFSQHLYQPLLFVDSAVLEVSPVPLNKGERRFIEDLMTFHKANGAQFKDKQLYLLRNLSRGRGVGFFEAGNFHPDFIVWQLLPGLQHVSFVDPKGIARLPPDDPKIAFHKTVKDIEARLGDPSVVLESFIVSNTPSHVVQRNWRIDKPEMVKRHILFQDEDGDSYIRTILGGVPPTRA